LRSVVSGMMSIANNKITVLLNVPEARNHSSMS
jgi:hypothetical protein